MSRTLALLALAAACQSALAQPGISAALLDSYRVAAMRDDAAFREFSVARGEQFFQAKNGDASCSTCHGRDPKAMGKHARTGKAIEPLAPAANAQRLSDPAKVEKWFKRNCNDVLQRACTAREKGDFVAWLVSVK